MNIGAVFPTCEIGIDPAVIRDFAQTAEDLGYSHIVCYDHVLGASPGDRQPVLNGPYTHEDPFHEPLVLFAWLAGATTRIEFATGVLVLPQRQTALVAKQAAELDLLSGGRLRLGMGSGWNYVEYESLGCSFKDRGLRMEEQVEVLRKLWSEPIVDFNGASHRIDKAGLNPLPERQIPIWFGGMAPVTVKRAARIGDGFLYASCTKPAQNLCKLATAELEKNGREQDQFESEVMVGFGDGPDAWHQAMNTWQALGATHLSMRAMSTSSALVGETDPGFTRPQQHIDALEVFMREMQGH